jgi:dolichyl-diphosphooligosaccharide--protein glycosyltransferase
MGRSYLGDKKERIIPAILIVLTAVALPWHNSIGLYILALLGLAATLVVVLGVPETRSASFLTLLAIALVVGAGWIGAVVGLMLVWWMGRFPARFRHPWSTRLIGVGLFVMLAVILGIQFQEYLSIAIPAYMGKLFGDWGSHASGLALLFPNFTASVRETQKVNLAVILEGIAFHPLLGAAGVLGYLVILWKKPAAVLLLPLLLLGLGAVRLGIRFTMFATPVVLLGLLVPLDWISAQAGERYAWDKRLRAAVSLTTVLVLIPVMVQVNWRIPVETVVGKAHARALTTLGEIADPAGTIWTWWDYGYASQHFAGLETFADGRRNTGDYLFSLGTVLGSDTLDRSAEFIHFAVWRNFEPWDVWNTWSEAELEAWLDGLGRGETQSEPLPAAQYLIVQWEGIPALVWIQYYGSWDFHTQEGQLSRVSKVMRPLELDLETGVFRFDGDQILHAVTVDILDESVEQHYDYPANAGGPHLLLNNATGEVMLLDETAYRSTFIQLLILPVDQLEDVSSFTLLIDDQPFVRVFELR